MYSDPFARPPTNPFGRAQKPFLEFDHPLLHLVARQERAVTAYRDFRRAVRDALNGSLLEVERIHNAGQAAGLLRKLDLDHDNGNAFYRALLWQMCAANPSLTLLAEMVAVDLKHASVTVIPHGWISHESKLPDSPSLPRIVGTTEQGRGVTQPPASQLLQRLPAAALRACIRAIELAGLAATDSSLLRWSLADCEVATKLLVVGTVLGAVEDHDLDFFGESPVGRLAFFEGVGLTLWKALSKQARRGGATGRELLWSPSMQQFVLLHLRGRAEAEVLAGTTILAAPTDGAEHADVPPGWLRVIPGVVPEATSKEEAQALKQYELLREPMPVARMPAPLALQKTLGQLQAEFPWADATLRELGRTLSTASLLGVQELVLEPLLLVGPPGAGKSRFARRLGELFGLPYLPLSIGGASDAKLLLGTSRGWSTAEASPLLGLLLRRRSASALVLLDEVDKTRNDTANAPPITSLLLGLLESETAARWYDGFLQTTCDLSRLSFVGTANGLSSMPKALLSRFTIAYMPAPGREHLPALVQGITRDLERQWRLPEGVLPDVPAHVWDTRGCSVRELKRLVLRYLHAWTQEYRDSARMH